MTTASLNVPATFASTGYLAVKDSNGVVRHELGNLPGVTDASGVISPAGQGSRARDASGNLIHDHLGLIAVMSQPVGSVHPATGQAITGTTGWVDITGSTLTYTPSRDVTVLVVAVVAGQSTGTPGTYCYTAINVDGTRHNLTDGPEGVHDNKNPGYTTSFLICSVSLSGGTSHTIKLQGSPDNTALTFNIFDSDTFMFLLGG